MYVIIQRLKPHYDETLSNVAFHFNLRRYTKKPVDPTTPVDPKVGRCSLTPG
jgi:hypothetical protein